MRDISYIFYRRKLFELLLIVISLLILNYYAKKLRVVKVIDMFEIILWKFYYKLMNNMLPPYFNMLKPNMPLVCDYYGLRNPKIHLPTIRHKTNSTILFNQTVE